VIFDLDGTLWDACSTSDRGWTEGLRALGVTNREISASEIASVCGLPFNQCVSRLFPDLAQISPELLGATLNLHERRSIEADGGALYPGVSTGLHKLVDSCKLFIVSNCQDWYLESFLSHSSLRHLFADWESHGRTSKSKAENIRMIIDRNKLESSIYIGDTLGDFDAAKGAGCDFAHVTYGFGKVTEPCASFDSFQELSRWLAGL
jgi:phosphoglycolate phosphatase